MDKVDIKSLTLIELMQEFVSLGEKSFRAKQVYSWIHQKLVQDFDEMTNISSSFRGVLKEKFYLVNLEAVEVLESKIDGTKSFCFHWKIQVLLKVY